MGKRTRAITLIFGLGIITLATTRLHADIGSCGGTGFILPFTDVSAGSVFYCSIAEAYFSGLTNGTTPTTYSPGDSVPREQMSAFVSRTMDQSVRRGSRRAVLGQFWTNQGGPNLALTALAAAPGGVKSDGADLWVACGGGTISRVRASDGRLIETWTGASQGAAALLVAMGKVFVTGFTQPNGTLYQIDPTQPAGAVSVVTNDLRDEPLDIAFDGARLWVANQGNGGAVSIITISPLTVTTITNGFTAPSGIIYDGTNIWVADAAGGKLKRVDSGGNVLAAVTVPSGPQFPAFDGTNIWVPCSFADRVSVVRATGALAGTVLANLYGNGLNFPHRAAFDGERILVTNEDSSMISLWRASDLTPIGTFSTGEGFSGPNGVCSDGLNFWITLTNRNALARF